MDIVILLFAGAIVLIAVILLTIIQSKFKPIKNERETAQVAEATPQPGARRRALAAARNNRIRQRLEENSSDEAEDPPSISFTEGKIGTKKLAKLQAKAERKAQREQEEKIREERKKAQLIAEEEQKKLREQEEERERKREEHERKLKEEKERQEHEEYLKMKEEFSVQEEGFDEMEENVCPVQDFIDHIKDNKVVVLEDLACYFKLKTQDVINRINSLQEEGKLTGVIDDRGKFIYISQDELESVAKFVKQRGRVSISELVENSNKLINLTQVESY